MSPLFEGRIKHRRSAGWPRATAPWSENRAGGASGPTVQMPVPWLNADCDEPENTDWTAFRDDGLPNAQARGCLVCGLAIDGPIYLCAQNGGDCTSGNGCHAKCAALAVKFCPNLNKIEEGETVAWKYDGPGVGVVLPTREEQEAGRCWGDHDPIDPSAMPLTRSELLAEVRRSVR